MVQIILLFLKYYSYYLRSKEQRSYKDYYITVRTKLMPVKIFVH